MQILMLIKNNKLLFVFTPLFLLSFQSINLTMFGSGISVNYSFVFVALILMLINRKLEMPVKPVFLAMIAYVAIFIYSSDFTIVGPEHSWLIRQVLSFGAFMTAFSFCFTKIEEKVVEAFVLSMILAGIGYTLSSLMNMFLMGDIYHVTYKNILFEPTFFFVKNIMGNSRVGFLIVSAFFLALYKATQKEIPGYLAGALLAILFIGVMTTFSRSTVVSFAFTFLAFLVLIMAGRIKVKFDAEMRSCFICFFLICATFLIIHPMVFMFYVDRLFVLGIESAVSFGAQSSMNPISSEGFRLDIWSTIIEHSNEKPIAGSGFVGVWSLFDSGVGSSHSDFLDVLFRTGYVGFVFYLALLSLMMNVFFKTDIRFFATLIAFLVFGFFHEAFKEAHGRFALAFMLGLTCTFMNKEVGVDRRH